MSCAKIEKIYFTAEGEEKGKPLIFRSIKDFPSNIKESDYPNLISIYWQYKPANEGGMPDFETNEKQIIFEDALEDLDQQGIGQLVLVVTGNGRKEWHWYVNNVENWMEKLNQKLSGKPLFPIEIENSHQPNWSLYHNFISGVEGI